MWSTAKVVSIFVIFGLAFLSGISACVAVICLIRKYGVSGHFSRAISLLNCFSGGVFFATAILNLLPEAREKMDSALELWGVETEYPLTEFLTGMGFLLILVFENLSHICCDGHLSEIVSHHKHGKGRNKHNSRVVYSKVPSAVDDESDTDEAHISDSEETDDMAAYQRRVDKNKRKHSHQEDNLANKQDNQISIRSTSDHNGDILAEKHPISIKETDECLAAGLPEDSTKSRIRGIVLLVALSLHMIFDGLALGLLDEDDKVWELLLALSVHKILMFLSIGLEVFELLKSFFKSVIVILFLALVSPVGIILGIVLTSSGDKLSEDAASAVLQGIATGTFIYVTFFEILLREFNEDSHDLLKVLGTVMGFSLVGAVKLLESGHD